MKKKLLIFAITWLAFTPFLFSHPTDRVQYAQETVTIGASDSLLNAGVYGAFSSDYIYSAEATLETAQIRWTVQCGQGVHRLLEIGQTINLDNETEIKCFRGLRTGGTSGDLKIQYFRKPRR